MHLIKTMTLSGLMFTLSVTTSLATEGSEESTMDKMVDKAAEVAEGVKEQSTEIAESVTEKGKEALSALTGEDKATVDEVVSKVEEAAKALKEQGEEALTAFHQDDGSWDADNPYAWKDTYVFVYNCKADKALAHPTLEGKTIMDIKDKNDKPLFEELCKAGELEGGGWVSYMWPKPGADEPSQKVSYALAVEGTDYQVSAGIYTEDKTVEDYKLKDKE